AVLAWGRSWWCVRPDSLADRITARKEDICKRLVDEGDGFAPLDVASIDATPAEQPHAHRLNVTAGDRTQPRGGWDGAFRIRSTFDEHCVAETGVLKRHARRGRDGRNARKGGQSIQDPLMGCHGRLAIPVFASRQSNAE